MNNSLNIVTPINSLYIQKTYLTNAFTIVTTTTTTTTVE